MNDTTWFWQIVDARGLADVSSDEFVALNELISKGERSETELDAISAAIGSPRFMDPPDGGDVSLAEQVRRMREQLDKVENAARAVEAWWLEDGRHAFNGSPYCIFAVRSALEGSGRNRADATPKSPLSDLSSLRKGAEVDAALEAADAVLTGEDACNLDPIVGSDNPHEHAAGLVREALRFREATRPHPTDPGHWRWRGE